MRKVGIKDVAHAAGVSPTTVSHALSGSGKVSPGTRKKVHETARALGYTPNRLAAGLRSRRTNVIGLVSDEIATTPFATNVLLGVQHAAEKAGVIVMTVNSERNAETEKRQITALHQHQVDGIIYARMYNQRVELPELLDSTPTVVLDGKPTNRAVPFVIPNEEQLAYDAVSHLIEHGHTKITFVQNADKIPASRGRLMGFERALQEHGIARSDNDLILASSSAEAGRTAVRPLLEREDRPTALFCFNDRIAMGAYQAAHLAGLAIPEDLSVISVDNFEVIADSLYPALTSMELPHFQMGVWAVERLLALIENSEEDKEEPCEYLIGCPMVVRDSVAPLVK